MKKIFRFLRSRYFITLSIILLQVLQIFIIIGIIYKQSLPLTLVVLIITVFVILYILDKDDPTDYKMPWLVITLFLPIIGATIYVLLNNDHLTRIGLKRFNNHIDICKRHKHDEEEVLSFLKKDDYDAYMQVNYIRRNAEVDVYGESKIEYLSSGEIFFDELVKELEKAKKYIFMEYFVVSTGKMSSTIFEILKKKASSGVEVYFMYDDFGSIKHLPEYFYKDLVRYGIHSIPSNKLVPQLTKVLNNRDHRKITIIDGNIGFTGGTNIADEYINEKKLYGHWKDTSVKIEGKAVKTLIKMFIGSWNIQHKKDMLDYDKYLNDEGSKSYKGDGIIIPYSSGPKPFYNENYGKGLYMNIIAQAKHYLYLTTPYLVCDGEVLDALRLAAKRGVDVRIITPHIPDKKAVFFMTRSNYSNLIKDGIGIYEYKPGFIHSKMFLCDDKIATVGSINLDYRSLVHHFECGCYMYNAKAIKDIKYDFKDILSKSIKINRKDAEYKYLKKVAAETMKSFTPLM